MTHTLAIAPHAGGGLVALVAGLVAVRGHRVAFGAYLVALCTMAAFLAVAVAADWPDLGTPSRILFAAFVVLAGYTVWRGVRAGRRLGAGPARPSAGYLDDLGFTLVALVDAFVVIALFDLGAPAWSLVAAGVLVAAGGHLAIRTSKSRLAVTG